MRLVRSLLEGVDVPTEIVVVCDGCRDGTEEALRGEVGTSIVVLSQPRGGPGAARNLGAAGAQAPTLLFLDDDMRAGPGLVRRHVEAQRRIGGGLVLGALPVDDASPASYLTEGLARWAARRDERLRAPGTVPGFGDVLTGNLSVARASFERLGGFDAAFTDDPRFGDEDLELGFRAIAAGERVAYAPSTRPSMRSPATSGAGRPPTRASPRSTRGCARTFCWGAATRSRRGSGERWRPRSPPRASPGSRLAPP
jgi:GT2 family glycosyltransferase